MKSVFINSSFNFINTHKELNDYSKIKIKYGLEVMYNFITKTSVVLLLAILFHALVEVFLIFLFYGLLRTFIHGVHGTSNTLCWIITLTSYVLSVFIIRTFVISNLVKIAICSISLVSIILWAPSDTKYRPLLNKRKRIYFKIISTLLASTYLLIILFTNYKYNNCLLISLSLACLAINSITYWLFGLKRNNYKSYK